MRHTAYCVLPTAYCVWYAEARGAALQMAYSVEEDDLLPPW
jgi:hypothetical protein